MQTESILFVGGVFDGQILDCEPRDEYVLPQYVYKMVQFDMGRGQFVKIYSTESRLSTLQKLIYGYEKHASVFNRLSPARSVATLVLDSVRSSVVHLSGTAYLRVPSFARHLNLSRFSSSPGFATLPSFPILTFWTRTEKPPENNNLRAENL